eukprot:6174819-Pleurochrysis_carterae.AAC.1
MGLVNVAPHHAREFKQTNELVRRTASVLRAARDSGPEYILEHPADRGALHSPLYLHKLHVPVRLLPEIAALRSNDSCALIPFPPSVRSWSRRPKVHVVSGNTRRSPVSGLLV